jgi:hypothetical protein
METSPLQHACKSACAGTPCGAARLEVRETPAAPAFLACRPVSFSESKGTHLAKGDCRTSSSPSPSLDQSSCNMPTKAPSSATSPRCRRVLQPQPRRQGDLSGLSSKPELRLPLPLSAGFMGSRGGDTRRYGFASCRRLGQPRFDNWVERRAAARAAGAAADVVSPLAEECCNTGARPVLRSGVVRRRERRHHNIPVSSRVPSIYSRAPRRAAVAPAGSSFPAGATPS